jgi:RecJ-like exonuclease
MRYRKVTYEDCKTCEGEGFIITGYKAGFNVKNMEVTMKNSGYACPSCSEKSKDEYEYTMEMKSDEARGN